jgi:hypothetical protein
MTSTFQARFDGKVVVPREPVDLPADEDLIVHVRPVTRRPEGTPGIALANLAGSISAEDAKQMMDAIEEACGRVDPGEW